MKSFRLKVKKFLEEESADEYNGDTVGMYIGGTIGTLMMVAMILMGGIGDTVTLGTSGIVRVYCGKNSSTLTVVIGGQAVTGSNLAIDITKQ